MKVKVLSNINSGQYVTGDVIILDDLEGNQLIEAGAVELTDLEVTDSRATAEQAEQARTDQILADDQAREQAQSAGDAQEATPPVDPLPQVLAPEAEVPNPQAPNTSPPPTNTGSVSNPTAEQIAQDVASTESKSKSEV